jgi:hypothetical protein
MAQNNKRRMKAPWKPARKTPQVYVRKAPFVQVTTRCLCSREKKPDAIRCEVCRDAERRVREFRPKHDSVRFKSHIASESPLFDPCRFAFIGTRKNRLPFDLEVAHYELEAV